MKRRTRKFSCPTILETLEQRELLSVSWRYLPSHRHTVAPKPAILDNTLSRPVSNNVTVPAPKNKARPNSNSPPGNAFTPAQIRAAYGMDLFKFNGVTADGSGQTIALIVAYDYPTALADANTFSTQFGLPLFNQTGGPTFQRVAQDGSQNFPATDTSTANTWEQEAALDIQWTHAIAPMANIILVEATSAGTFPTFPLLDKAVDWARHQSAVSVISMSFSSADSANDTYYDQFLSTPYDHQGITFIAASGDNGSPAGYPAYSPNVVGVGGTSLTLSNGQYLSETGWNKSGGGITNQESKPWYQVNVTQSATQRTAPDISFDGDPNTGVAICDSWDYGTSNSWIKIGGTSLSAPLFAGMVAVANQGRALLGLGTLDGFSQTLPMLYNATSGDFHDITTGSNGGYSAGTGYDLVTGRGSPIANRLIPDLVGAVGFVSGTVYQDNNGNGVPEASDTPLPGIQVYVDANNNGIFDIGGAQTQSTGIVNLSIPDDSTVGTTSQLTIAGLNGAISDINVNLSITHPFDRQISAYLIGPDGTKITLCSGIGSYSANFTNTTFDDQATSSITTGSAPFTGSYVPAWLLAAFNGKSANGTWTLKVTDTITGTTGALNNWSLSVTTASEVSTITASDGTYYLGPLATGTQIVRRVQSVPAGSQACGPTSYSLNLTGNTTGANFAQVLTTFNATAAGDTFYVWLDNGMTAIGKSTTPTDPIYHVPTGISLTFNLTSSADILIVDYINGSPLPTTNIQVNGGGLPDSEVRVFGAGATLTMTDTAIGPATGGSLLFTDLGTLSIWNSIVHYSGDLSTLQYLYVRPGTIFYWG